MTSLALAFRPQTATSPGWAVLSGTLIVLRICATVRATFQILTSSIAPCGVNCQETSLPIRTGSVLVVSGPASGKLWISSPLM
jgi:hypothetical protein